ncbi:hypothetical protein ACFSX9_04140 [Flavobacterium ardleyense]|uniref:Uncharacterized protein n=1 Tax=Flavobacterium ardleyense TaxID=2038737 RepID=A0ABW5Z5C7_9FLAO
MKVIFNLFFLFFSVCINSQIKTDTIFSGNKLYVNFENSIVYDINKQIKEIEICKEIVKTEHKYKHLQLVDEGFSKAQIPYLLKNYCKKTKSTIFEDFNALIYSSYLNNGTFLSETYLLEFFFESEDKAKICIKNIEKLIALRKKTEKIDEEVYFGTYNWFYIYK